MRLFAVAVLAGVLAAGSASAATLGPSFKGKGQVAALVSAPKAAAAHTVLKRVTHQVKAPPAWLDHLSKPGKGVRPGHGHGAGIGKGKGGSRPSPAPIPLPAAGLLLLGGLGGMALVRRRASI